MIFLNEFVLKHSLKHGYYIRLRKFVEKILESDLIENHKKNILEEFEIELIADYLNLINNLKTLSKYSKKTIPFAITYFDREQMNDKWTSILDTNLCGFYNWYQNKVKY